MAEVDTNEGAMQLSKLIETELFRSFSSKSPDGVEFMRDLDLSKLLETLQDQKLFPRGDQKLSFAKEAAVMKLMKYLPDSVFLRDLLFHDGWKIKAMLRLMEFDEILFGVLLDTTRRLNTIEVNPFIIVMVPVEMYEGGNNEYRINQIRKEPSVASKSTSLVPKTRVQTRPGRYVHWPLLAKNYDMNNGTMTGYLVADASILGTNKEVTFTENEIKVYKDLHPELRSFEIVLEAFKFDSLGDPALETVIKRAGTKTGEGQNLSAKLHHFTDAYYRAMATAAFLQRIAASLQSNKIKVSS